ncbi:unnamed protein product [Amoebophrya sp. A120]|nr:unnamed protein product [Amoebophrya sp. A120]|eukprot:GSA120T00001423001.1
MFAPSYRNIYLLIVADKHDIERAAANSRFLTKVRWDRVDTEGFEPHDDRNNLLVDNYLGDRFVYERYKKMVEVFERHKATMPREVRRYHYNKLVELYSFETVRRQEDELAADGGTPTSKFSAASAVKMLNNHGAAAPGGNKVVQLQRGSSKRQLKSPKQAAKEEKLTPKEEKKAQVQRALYIRYLEKRTQGLTSFRAMFEVNREYKLRKKPLKKLQSIWDRMGCECGPLWVVYPYSVGKSHVPWAKHQVRNLLGKKVAVNFSPADRLELINNTIEAHLDLADLLLYRGGVFLRDYFPLEDLRLKALATVPMEEYLLRGDDITLKRGMFPVGSRYFVTKPDEEYLRARHAVLKYRDEEKQKRTSARKTLRKFCCFCCPTLRKAMHMTDDNPYRVLNSDGCICDVAGKLEIFGDIDDQKEHILAEAEELRKIQEEMDRENSDPFGISDDSLSPNKRNSSNKRITTSFQKKRGSKSDRIAKRYDYEKMFQKLSVEGMPRPKLPNTLEKYLALRSEHAYFGQKLGIYCVFVRHFASALRTPAEFGLLVTLFQAIISYLDLDTTDPTQSGLKWTASHGVPLLNAAFLAWWGPSYIASWERVQKRKMLQLFGVVPGKNYKHASKHQPRKRFHGLKQKSAITGEYEVVFPVREARARAMYSNLCSMLFCTLVLCIVVGVSGIQFVIYEHTMISFSDSLSYNYSLELIGVMNAVVVLIFNAIYSYVGLWLTHYENHATYEGFLESFAIKSCVFQFLNSYSALFYQAFAQKFLLRRIAKGLGNDKSDEWYDMQYDAICPKESILFGSTCEMGTTNRTLVSLVLVFMARNVTELGLPILAHWWAEWKRKTNLRAMDAQRWAFTKQGEKSMLGRALLRISTTVALPGQGGGITTAGAGDTAATSSVKMERPAADGKRNVDDATTGVVQASKTPVAGPPAATVQIDASGKIAQQEHRQSSTLERSSTMTSKPPSSSAGPVFANAVFKAGLEQDRSSSTLNTVVQAENEIQLDDITFNTAPTSREDAYAANANARTTLQLASSHKLPKPNERGGGGSHPSKPRARGAPVLAVFDAPGDITSQQIEGSHNAADEQDNDRSGPVGGGTTAKKMSLEEAFGNATSTVLAADPNKRDDAPRLTPLEELVQKYDRENAALQAIYVGEEPELPDYFYDDTAEYDAKAVRAARHAGSFTEKSGGADLPIDRSSSNASSKESVRPPKKRDFEEDEDGPSGLRRETSGIVVPAPPTNMVGLAVVPVAPSPKVETSAVDDERYPAAGTRPPAKVKIADGRGGERDEVDEPKSRDGPTAEVAEDHSRLHDSKASHDSGSSTISRPLPLPVTQTGLLTDAKLLENSLGAQVQEQRYRSAYGTPTFAFDGTIDDYSELCVMFGFLMLFSIALPMVSMLIYLACVMEVAVDSFKFTRVIRRPFPAQAVQGVGVWISILRAVVWASVPTNACLLVVTAQIHTKDETLQDIVGNKDTAAIFGIAFFLALIKFVAMHSSPEDRNFQQVTQRIDHCMNKLMMPLPGKSKLDMELLHEDAGGEQTDFRIRQPYEFTKTPVFRRAQSMSQTNL